MIRQSITKKTDIITFGKHKGKAVAEILIDDAQYILWLDEQEIVEFPEEIIDEAQDKSIDQKYEYLIGDSWGWDGFEGE